VQKTISIVTGWGDGYGAGHVQRMASLCLALAEVPGIVPVIVSSTRPEFLDCERKIDFRPALDPASSLVVRDMRDSTREQMLELKKTAPVLAVDDIGEGRGVADHVLDLLPNPAVSGENPHYRRDLYLYGGNFMGSLRRLDRDRIPKDMDVLVYSGHLAGGEDEAFFRSIIPGEASAVILGGSGRTTLNTQGDESGRMEYAELLARAKVFVSHFGISLYEARLAGCSVMALNPSAYHSSLADMVLGDVVDVNAGERASLDPAEVRGLCAGLLRDLKTSDAKPREMLALAERSLVACRDFVVALASGARGKRPS